MGSIDRDDHIDDYLAAFRRERPGPDARRRNWEALRARLEDHEGPRRARAAAEIRRLTAAVGLTLAIAAAVLLLIRGVGSGISAIRERQAVPMEAVDHAPTPAPRLATSVAPDRAAPAPPTPIIEPAPAPAPAPSLAPPVLRPRPRVEAGPPPAPSPDTLAAETRLLALARRGLAADDLPTALTALRQHARRFPDGALTEERLAYLSIAQCRSTPRTTTTAASFYARYPSSPLSPRVRAACD